VVTAGKARTAILHYTAPPVIGGVEAVIGEHARVFVRAGYPVTIVAGRGEESALPPGAEFTRIPAMDSRYREIEAASERLERGEVPDAFDDLVDRLIEPLKAVLGRLDTVIVHNVFTKHFNLPLTAALHRLLDEGAIGCCIAWCHDFTWTSPNSRSQVHPGYPWDLLRTRRPDTTYVVVSEQRQEKLAALFDCPPDEIRVVYNGVEPATLLGLSDEGSGLIERLGLLQSDLVLLMPVRVTRAKNVEYALRVVVALKAQGCNPKLVLTGPPDPHDGESMAYFRSLQALRRELDVEAEMRFVFESGPDPEQPYTIDEQVVGDLYRVSDVMFMPSHREGFGMPVLEAGLIGVPVVCSGGVPAAQEIGSGDVIRFDVDERPARLAERILAWAAGNPTYHLRRRVRQTYTWQEIFRRDIRPLLGCRADIQPLLVDEREVDGHS
jgi:glycosyltransferase involved in cell wall biosynthesis